MMQKNEIVKVKIEDMNNRKNRFVILQRNGFFSTM